MSAGFYLVTGSIYLNMGAQIMFVLCNRMKAQKIDMKDIGSKIMCDIVLYMFKRNFVQNLIKPQMPLSIPTFYQMFIKIVNSSAMKLDKPSMEKLFYLVLMTFKKQIFLLSSPLQMYTLTLTHLQDVGQMIKSNSQAFNCVQECIQIFKNQYDKYTYLNYLEMKEQILSMLQSYKSRIVLFCETGSQDQNGNMIFIPRNTHIRKPVGIGQNHHNIDFPQFSQWNKTKNLQYSTFKTWKTTLGKDDYDNSRGSSKIIEQKSKAEKQFFQQDNNKSLSQMLGIKNMKLQDYEVHLDIFGGEKSVSKKSQPVKAAAVKTVQTKVNNDIKKKIQKEFNDLNLQKQGDDDIDLLQLMDS